MGELTEPSKSTQHGLLPTDRIKMHNYYYHHYYFIINKKHLKNVGPIRHNEPPHAHSPDVASGNTRAACASMSRTTTTTRDRGPLWPHGMGPTSRNSMEYIQNSSILCGQFSRPRLSWYSSHLLRADGIILTCNVQLHHHHHQQGHVTYVSTSPPHPILQHQLKTVLFRTSFTEDAYAWAASLLTRDSLVFVRSPCNVLTR